MQNTKKFYLIDSSNIDQLLNKHQSKERLKPIQKKELSRLDELMSDIISNPSLTDSEKVTEYNKVLAEFQDVAVINPKTLKHTTQLTIPTTSTTTNTEDLEEKDSKEHEYLLRILKGNNKKVKDLMKILNNSNQIKLTNKGEVIIKDKKIPNSNITDLLNRAVNSKQSKVNSIITPAWNEFQELLEELNIPKSIVKKQQQTPVKTPSKAARPRRLLKQLKRWSPYDYTENAKQK